MASNERKAADPIIPVAGVKACSVTPNKTVSATKRTVVDRRYPRRLSSLFLPATCVAAPLGEGGTMVAGGMVPLLYPAVSVVHSPVEIDQRYDAC